MVGGESLGCRTCKQRRIKCDERKPICRRCEKSNRFCTGPESAFRFYYGSDAQKTQLETAISTSQAPNQRQVSKNQSRLVRKPNNEGLHIPSFATVKAMPDSSMDRSRRLLVFALKDHVPGSYNLQQLGSYFDELPARIGQSSALDAVIECFVTSYARRYLPLQERTWDDDPSTELVVYGKAITALRNALNDSFAQSCEETLCASLSLFLYEFFMQEPTRQCVSLAGGVSSILKAWGPSKITSRFALTLFESHYVTVIAHALVFGKECFIADPGWDKVFQACPNIAPEERAIWLTLARIPKFLDNVRNVSCGALPDTERVIKQGHHLRRLLLTLDWHNSKALSQVQVYYQAPEVYDGPLPILLAPEGICEARTVYDIVSRVAFIRAGLVAVNSALRRIGDTDIDRFVEDNQNSRWLCSTMPVAERFGVLNGGFYTLAAVAAFGLSNEPQRRLLTTTVSKLLGRCAQWDGETYIPSEEQYQTTYTGLQCMYDTMTGGPVVREL